MKICLSDKIFEHISTCAENSGTDVYVIGGFVRDCLLNRKHSGMDIDIVVRGSGIEFARILARQLSPKIKVTSYRNYGTAMFNYGKYMLEFVGARKESYSRDSRKPLVEDGSLEDDQNRRDFTINALALSLNKDSFGDMIDPFGGLEDLEAGIIKTPLDPDQTFSDDPLRMLRAIRFSSQLNFGIHKSTFASIRNNAARIKIISAERISTELNKIMLTSKPSVGLNQLYLSGLLDYILPELSRMKGVDMKDNMGHKDNFEHTLQVVDNLSTVSEKLWLRWAALLHDIAKPITKKYIEGIGWTFHGHEFKGSLMVPAIFKRLRLPLNEDMKYVQKLVLLHQRPMVLSQEEVTDSALRRLLFDVGEDIDDLMTLCEADITSQNEKKVRQYLANFKVVRKKLVEVEARDNIRNFQPPVDGEEIMTMFSLKPGKEIGMLKTAVKDAILDGKISNDIREAREYLLKVAGEMGINKKK